MKEMLHPNIVYRMSRGGELNPVLREKVQVREHINRAPRQSNLKSSVSYEMELGEALRLLAFKGSDVGLYLSEIP
jgi:hypothetical protein